LVYPSERKKVSGMIDVARARRDLTVTASYTYLNTGTMGPCPTPVHRAFLDAYQAWQDSGPGNPENYGAAHTAHSEPARASLARLLGVGADEIALTANSTDGVNIVISGLDWRPGDEFVTTDQEHPAVFVPWLNVQRRYGAVGRLFKVAGSAAEIVDNFRAVLSARTRLVVISHVSSQSGIRLPVAEIARLGHAAGALVCLDGAQAVGQVRVDAGRIGCDFYALNGHKWLLGPVGTGALVVRKEALDRIAPTFVGGGSNEPVDYLTCRDLRFLPSATRFENATRNWTAYAGLKAAIEYLEGFGLDKVEARGLTLAARLRAGLAEIPGVAVTSPGGPELGTALVSWALAGWTAQDQYSTLLTRFGVCCRPVAELNAVRASCAFFNLEEEVDLLVRSVATLASERGARAS
jgi:selenocysteine lyase/cysteine desulfurase